MKFDGDHVYVYIGWNGFIFALMFNFRGKNYDIEYALHIVRSKIWGDDE